MATYTKPQRDGSFGIWGDLYNACLDALNAELIATTAKANAAATPTEAASLATQARDAAIAASEKKINRTGAAVGAIATLGSNGDLIFTTPAGVTLPDASPNTKGVVQLRGALGGTATDPTTPTAVHKDGDEVVNGIKTFTAKPSVPAASFPVSALALSGTATAGTFITSGGEHRVPSGGGATATAVPVTRARSFVVAADDLERLQLLDPESSGQQIIVPLGVLSPGDQVPTLQMGGTPMSIVGGSTLIHTFNGLASTTDARAADTGQAPQILRGTWGTSGLGRAQATSVVSVTPDPGDAEALLVYDCGSANGFVQVTLAVPGTDTGVALMCRVQDVNNFYMLQLDRSVDSGPAVRLHKRTNGAFAQMGATIAITPAENDVYRIGFNGATLEAFRNGALLLTHTDPTAPFTTSGRVGLRAGSNTARFDDLIAGAVQVDVKPSQGTRLATGGSDTPGSLLKARTDRWSWAGGAAA